MSPEVRRGRSREDFLLGSSTGWDSAVAESAAGAVVVVAERLGVVVVLGSRWIVHMTLVESKARDWMPVVEEELQGVTHLYPCWAKGRVKIVALGSHSPHWWSILGALSLVDSTLPLGRPPYVRCGALCGTHRHRTGRVSGVVGGTLQSQSDPLGNPVAQSLVPATVVTWAVASAGKWE